MTMSMKLTNLFEGVLLNFKDWSGENVCNIWITWTCCKMSISLQKSASMRPRTSPPNFEVCGFCKKRIVFGDYYCNLLKAQDGIIFEIQIVACFKKNTRGKPHGAAPRLLDSRSEHVRLWSPCTDQLHDLLSNNTAGKNFHQGYLSHLVKSLIIRHSVRDQLEMFY